MTLTKVIINLYDHENVLKGQHILAQGNALGINAITKIVRAIMAEKEKFSFRTKGMISCFLENYVLQFRPKQDFHLLYISHTDGFGCDFVAPGYAILPLSGRGNPDALE